ncbi:MAG: acetyltransferase [Syntrophaceae bacterium]|nr:acetyltransferase [Syntrophaceae bacterium]
MKKIKLAVYGAGGFGREVAWLAQSVLVKNQKLEIVCFIDDDPKICGMQLNDLKVMSLSQAKKAYADLFVVSGIGVPKIREKTIKKAIAADFRFATLIHPNVEMSKWIEIGEGAVICAGNILTTNISLGKHVQINLDCTIGHDVVMEDYATLAPGVHLSGYVHVGKRAYIGTGAVIINGIQGNPIVIGDDAVVGAGACVTQSIPPGETWVGVPARPIRK